MLSTNVFILPQAVCPRCELSGSPLSEVWQSQQDLPFAAEVNLRALPDPLPSNVGEGSFSIAQYCQVLPPRVAFLPIF